MVAEHSFDVVVAGGGPAGVAAALSAARAGAKVALLEGTSAFGGMATTGMVPAFCPYTNGKEIVIRGIGLEILEKLRERGGAKSKHPSGASVKDDYDWVRINAEKLKLLLDDLLLESGACLRLFTQVTEPVVEKGRIVALKTWSKSGLELWRAKAFVDCTGDADVAARAGCPFEIGDENGLMQPSTVCFTIAGLREACHDLLDYGEFGKMVKVASLAGELTGKHDHHHCVSSHFPRTAMAGFNYKHQLNVDGTNADDLTRAIIEGRHLAHELTAFFRKHKDGFADAFVASTAELVGIRETRRIVGEYVMDAQHFHDARKSRDDIASYCYYIDIHAVADTEEGLDKLAGEHRDAELPEGKHYGVPYRSLIPKNAANLLVAGRSVSCDRAMQGSIRVMPGAFATGEAAGLAAKMAAASDGAVRDVDVPALQKSLLAQGAFIDM